MIDTKDKSLMNYHQKSKYRKKNNDRFEIDKRKLEKETRIEQTKAIIEELKMTDSNDLVKQC
jgi:hypothetical protein